MGKYWYCYNNSIVDITLVEIARYQNHFTWTK